MRLVNPNLAARCLDEAGLPPLLPGEGTGEAPSMGVREKTQADLLADLYNPQMHLRARLQAGTLLGKLGDLRFAVTELNGVKVVLPQMVNVPAGEYLIGSKKDDEGSYQQEYPQHTIKISAFSIGKWPVTNAEFACFMAGGGYENDAFWEGEMAKRWLKGEDVTGGQFKTWLNLWKNLKGRPNWKEEYEKSGNFTPEAIQTREYIVSLTEDELKKVLSEQLAQKSRTQPAFWTDRERNNPSQPVVGITWFEARAYCAWLSTMTGRTYRLPTEVEWEAAARGSLTPTPSPAGRGEGVRGVRVYPWGSDWAPEKANSLEGRVLKPSPVGAYAAAGAEGPFGAEDQAGNVYDWTSSLYLPYPYDPAQSEILEAEGERVVRGGSWDFDRNYLRCACRYGFVPDFFLTNFGFRFVSPGL